MCNAIRYLLILCVCSLTQACSFLTLRAPACDPPPIPSSLLLSCPNLHPLQDGKLATLYQQMLADADLYRECLRRHDQLVAVVKYRDQVCERIRSQSQSTKAWWEFWK